jgi:transposase
MQRAEIITIERRRRWRLSEKQEIVAETLEPGSSVSAVAQRHGMHPSQLFAWRKAARDGRLVDESRIEFAPVVGAGPVIGLPSGARVWLAVGRTDMRKGFDGLAAAVQERMAQDPFCGHLFVFRGRRGDLLKVLWWDGQGLCLFAKRLETGRFVWPSPADGKVVITSAQLGMLLEGIDWRMPRRTWRPQTAG